MAESAGSTPSTFNPDTPVQGEGSIKAKGSDPVMFDDMEEFEKPSPAQRKDKSDGKASGGNAKKTKEKPEATDGDDDDAGEGKEKPAKPKAKDDEPKPEDGKAEKRAKPKLHKARSGESSIDVPGDSVFAVTVDGKNEDVTLEDLRSNYSGKVHYDKKFTELDKRERAHTEQVESMNSMVNKLFETAKNSPDDGWDFLAEISGKDAVEFKTTLLREQRKEAQALAAMSDDEFEAYLKEQSLGWREKKLSRRDKEAKDAEAKTAASVGEKSARDKYGIDEAQYKEAKDLAKQHLKGEEPTLEQVVYADRHIMAYEVVQELVPHLEKHEKFGTILEDIVQDLVRHPSMNREKLGKLLKDVWGQDDEGLKNLSRKARRNADADEDIPPSRASGSKKAAVFFDDLD